jgi:8-oxo-dGTP diphosphatase
MKNQILIVMGLIKKGNKYLLLKRSNNNRTNKGKWQFPEGKIEFGEKPIKALKRELKEETGFSLVNAKLKYVQSSVVNYPNHGKYHLIRLIFSCKVSGKIKLSKEHKMFGWFTKEDIKKIKMVNGINKKIIL